MFFLLIKLFGKDKNHCLFSKLPIKPFLLHFSTGVAQNRTIQAVLKKIALILLTHYKFEKKEGKLTENYVELVVDYKNNLVFYRI